MISLCREEYAAQRTVLGLTPPTQEEARFFILALGAAGAVLGVTVGTLVSLLYLVLRFRLHGDGTVPRLYKSSPAPKSKGETRRLLLKITLPVALGSAASSVAGLIDATFLQNRIAAALEQFPQRFLAVCQGKVPTAYWETPQAIPTYLYGCYSLAMTVYLLVPGITQAFGTSALPGVTSAWARGSKRELRGRMEAVVRVTSLFCFPAGLSLTALAEPVAGLLYGEGPSTAAIAQSLALLGLASLPAAMSGPLSSMLQAVGRADLPVKLLLLAMAVKLGANWVLCGIPEVNILGAGVGTCLCYLVLTLTQFWKLRRASGVGLSTVGVFLRPFCCALLCAASQFVWTIDISNCDHTLQAEALRLTEEAGLRPGVLRSQVDSNAIKNYVMMHSDRFSFLAVNVKGSRAEIVAQGRDPTPELVPVDQPCDIIADKTGVIADMQVKAGLGMKKVGETVVAGDMLVSGTIVSAQQQTYLVHAMADIELRTWHDIKRVMPTRLESKVPTGRQKTRYSLVVGGRRFPFLSLKVSRLRVMINSWKKSR